MFGRTPSKRSLRSSSKKRTQFGGTLPRNFKLNSNTTNSNTTTTSSDTTPKPSVNIKSSLKTSQRRKKKSWNSTLKTPLRLGRLASSELLRAASSPTGAAAKCAETLKKTFSSSSKAANISVYVRVRPTVTRRSNNQQNEQEEENNENMENKHPDETEPIEEPSFTVESDSTLIHRISGQQGKRFLMDKIFEEESTQEEVFERIGRAQVDKAMSGFHGSIFAYGQTSTGKTYTMLGPNGGRGDLSSPEISRDIGLIPRILHYLFQKVRSQDDNKNDNSSEQNRVQKVTVSYLEIYNETLRDLLNEDSEEGHNLPIKEHKRDGPFVKGLTEKVVTCPDEALSLMEIGNAARSQAKTRMNDTSSRSHAVFTIRVDGQMCSATADGRRRKFTSKMNLVDLAGSERQRNTGAEGKRLREGSAINKSLSVLGTVIMNLVDIGDGRSRHVHYRDSKLTFLLRDSLGGSTYTSIIATVTSKEEHAQETLSTLHFAQRAKSVKNVVTRNVEVIDTVSGLRRELRSLKKQLKRSESTGSNQMSTSEDQGSDTAVRTELNEHIRKAAEMQREQRDMEEQMQLILAEKQKYEKVAKEREEALDRLRVAHAMKVSERRRSSIGMSKPTHSGRESTLFSIFENHHSPMATANTGSMEKQKSNTTTTTTNDSFTQTTNIEDQRESTAAAAAAATTTASTVAASTVAVASAAAADSAATKVAIAQAVDVAVAAAVHTSEIAANTAKEEWVVKDAQYQKELNRLRSEMSKAQEASGQISVAAGEEQKQLKEQLRVSREELAAVQTELEFKCTELMSVKEDAKDEAEVLRERLMILENGGTKTLAKMQNSATVVKTISNKMTKTSKQLMSTSKASISTGRITRGGKKKNRNKNKKTLSLDVPSLSSSPNHKDTIDVVPAAKFAFNTNGANPSPLMSMIGMSFASSTISNPTSATALLAGFSAGATTTGDNATTMNGRDSSSSVCSTGSSDSDVTARLSSSSQSSTRSSSGMKPRKSLRDMFLAANGQGK